VDDRSVSHVYITKRVRPGGRTTWVVRYRWGGRAFRLVHLGSRSTEREAKKLRDWAAGELVAGRDPRTSLAAMRDAAAHPSAPRDVDGAWESFIRSRLDTTEGTRRNYRKAKDAFFPLLGARDVGSLRVADVQAAVGTLSESLSAATVAKYVNTLRLVLDYAEVEPNAARDRRVKLPRVVREEAEPPDAHHIVAMLARLTTRWRLAFVTTEQTGMRVGEIASVAWRDVDASDSRFRMRARETKSRRGKWVPVPRWVMDEIEATCPLEDRLPDRRVFTRVDEAGLRNAMLRACRTAKIAVYSPHDLRHRRITIWHHAGVPMREIQERVGHSRASITLDVYSHVMPVAEVPADELQALIRRGGEVRVRSRA
jgi:integrase